MPGEPSGLFEQITDAVNGTPLDADAAAKLGQEAKALKQAATEGTFAVNPEYGQESLKRADKALHTINQQRTLARRLSQAPRLGTAPDAITVAKFHQDAATGDHHPFLPVLDSLAQILIDTKHGISECMKHYSAAEADSRARLNGLRDD